MSEKIDYGRFAERLRRVMPRWGDRDRMAPEEFAEHLADTGPRWDLLRVFQEEWGYEPPGGEPAWPRWSESEHEAYVRRLRAEWTGEEEDAFARCDLTLPVPAALDEWWDLPFNSFTYRPRLYWTNPEWPPTVRPDPSGYGVSDGLPPDSPFVAPDDDHRVCVFKAEYQYCNEWGYLAAEAGLPDPRVLVSSEDGWVVQAGSISEFFLQLAVMRLPAHFGWTVRLYEAEPGVVDRVRRDFPELGLLPWRELGSRAVVHGAPDALIYLDDGGYADFSFLVHARTRTALEEVARTLGVDWSDEIESPPADEPESPDEAEPAGPEPLSLRAGQADAGARWTVEDVSDRPLSSLEPEPPARLTGAGRPAGLTVWVTDPDADVAAGDQAGGLHLWPAARPDGSPEPEGTAAPLSRTAHDAPVTAIACRRFDGLGATVVSGDSTGVVNLWLPDDGDWGPAGIGRHGGTVIALSAECLETGPAIAAAWSTGTVRLWDVGSGLDATLTLGSGIETIALNPEGTLTVGGATGTATVRLDTERLWPRRALTELVHRFEWERLDGARGPAPEIPDQILAAASADAETAAAALAGLRAVLYDGGTVFPVTVAAAPYLALLAADPDNRVRGPLLSLLLEIARAVPGPVGEGEDAVPWAEHARSTVEECLPVVSDLLDDADPGVREAAERLLSEFPGQEPDSFR
ncbi:hypothetical protein NE236_36680 [Actinoallomurus purpureus]|uniref:hypothetical protein n=1 Tax=Actinoallomurus purpureus TaxID=478114 RepID=UPI002092E6A0|nr:hypothetical protein [Actinoallomurus purpureus]MCO6010510.1 hypothetical protein [Actinoallomurus purpureus]